MKLILDEEKMTAVIKDLLSMKNDSIWKVETIKESLAIEFEGNCFKVQQNILDWLNIPERKLNIKVLGRGK